METIKEQSRLKKFWSMYENKIVLGTGLVLIASISFQLGYDQGMDYDKNNSVIVIEKPAESSKTSPKEENGAIMVSNSLSEEKSLKKPNLSQENVSSTQEKCAYVGSKNSNKFYPPSCSYAKRIKPENVVCFINREEALAQGRTESSGCSQ